MSKYAICLFLLDQAKRPHCLFSGEIVPKDDLLNGATGFVTRLNEKKQMPVTSGDGVHVRSAINLNIHTGNEIVGVELVPNKRPGYFGLIKIGYSGAWHNKHHERCRFPVLASIEEIQG
jgi:hypothetical protein